MSAELKRYLTPATEDGLPIVQPFSTLEEVMLWQPNASNYECYHKASVPFTGKPLLHKPRTLVCHDMAGGYLHDRYIQGIDDNEMYRFFHWNKVDVFIYFSHHFITIPPPSWTNIAHKHNTLMLGTIITEWEEGKSRCEAFLKSKEAYSELVEKLVSMAEHYGFEGWLVNIENKIEKEVEVENLCEFVKLLTQRMKEVVGSHSVVLWYDSVINTGELKWQNQLNAANSKFFDACDGIFLNYTWKEEGLSQSAKLAGDRLYDVYVGADVFGRGCPGGGGYNTIEAVRCARKFDLSVAIFAQGWVYEREGRENFTQNEIKFWELLSQCCPNRKITSLPIYTDFCQGIGSKFYRDGELVHSGSWGNLTTQTMQPVLDTNVQISTEDAFHSSSCLRVCKQSQGKMQSFRLFSTDIPITSTLYVSYSYKLPMEGDKCHCALKLEFDDKTFYLTDGVTDVFPDDEMDVTMEPLKADQLHPPYLDMEELLRIESKNGWNTRHYLLRYSQGSTLHSVDLSLQDDSNDEREVSLGHIQIAEASDIVRSLSTNVVSKCEIRRSEIEKTPSKIGAILSWHWPEPMNYFSVYIKGHDKTDNDDHEINDDENHVDFRLFGHTHCTRFVINDLKIKQGKYRIAGTHMNGVHIQTEGAFSVMND